ncbi:hypothetical protein E4T56_gene10425, partial [Termitomyces sp. T112]
MIVMAGPGVMASGQWISNAGDGREAMVWREDCVESAVAVLRDIATETRDHAGRIYNITGPELQSFAEVTAILSQITGVPLAYMPVSDEAQYAIFDAMGIPRRPVDDQSVNGIPWNSDDMVTFGAAIREGFLAICSDDVEKLTGRPARSITPVEPNIAHKDRLFIGGTWVAAHSGRMIEQISPDTEEPVSAVAEADEADMDAAAAAARHAFDHGPWPRMQPGERLAVMKRMAAILHARVGETARAWSMQMGGLASFSGIMQAGSNATFDGIIAMAEG